MFKKLLAIGCLSLCGLSSAMAGLYIGPMFTYNSISAGDIDYQGFSPRLALGYSTFMNTTLYIAGELEASPFTMDHNNNPNAQGSLKTTYSYGASIIPGVYFDEVVLGYARLGVLDTRFSKLNKTTYGFQLAGGLEVTVARNWQVRGEVGRVQYQFIDNIGHPYAYQYGVGFTRRFD
jgi:opacity protein-like surface antigen